MKLADEMSAFHPQVSWSRIAKTEQPLSFLKDDFQKPLSGVNPSLKEPEYHVSAEQSIRKPTVSQYKIRVRRSNRNTCSSEYRLLHLLLRQSSDCSFVFTPLITLIMVNIAPSALSFLKNGCNYSLQHGHIQFYLCQ